MKKGILKKGILWFAAPLIGYLAIMAGMFLFQRDLLYHPQAGLEAPAYYGLEGAEVVSLRAEDGVPLTAWYLPAQEDFPTLIFFHGNSGNLGGRAHKLASFHRTGFGVLALSYRGFGSSGGAPDEAGLYADARAAVRYLTETLYLPLAQLIPYGESLGTGVAVQMATEFAFPAVVLEAPYTSVADRAAEIYFWLPAKWLVRDRFDSLKKLAELTTPVLILHGLRDQTIPVAHGRALLAAAPGRKQGVFLPEAGHNDIDPIRSAEALQEFLSIASPPQ